MDEATASLDAETSFEVLDAILKLDGYTRVIVTHDLNEQAESMFLDLVKQMAEREGVTAAVDLEARTAPVNGEAEDAVLRKAVEDAGYTVVSIG